MGQPLAVCAPRQSAANCKGQADLPPGTLGACLLPSATSAAAYRRLVAGSLHSLLSRQPALPTQVNRFLGTTPLLALPGHHRPAAHSWNPHPQLALCHPTFKGQGQGGA